MSQDEKKSLSPAMEDYLRAIYKLEEKGASVTTSVIADRLGVAPASVTKMMKRLASMELVQHEPYRGVGLTPDGEKAAAEMVRHHRLIELFLTEVVGVPWDRVHEEAHRLEHALSEYLEDKLSDILGDPKVDPHGQLIPCKDGRVESRHLRMLWDLEEGTFGFVAEIEDHDPALLRYVAERSLFPGKKIQVLERDPYGGSVIVSLGEERCAVGQDAAKQIWISEQPQP
ncbi:MAG: metal-dependent transcriptional regulator [Myxococcales bacterium]|nr:metal-dependent transcriptional regulator [Myxococcales bacterium]